MANTVVFSVDRSRDTAPEGADERGLLRHRTGPSPVLWLTVSLQNVNSGGDTPGQLHERKPSLQTRFGAHTSGRGSLPIRSDRSHTSEATDAINQVWDDKPEGFFVSPLPENGCLSIRLNLLAIDAIALGDTLGDPLASGRGSHPPLRFSTGLLTLMFPRRGDARSTWINPPLR